MMNVSDFTGRVLAALGSMALTATLLVSSFAVPQASSLAGVLV